MGRTAKEGCSDSLQVETDFSNDNDVRAVLIVHDTKPPFLDGRVSFTKQSQAVMPIRDPTSDMAVIARNGSHLVKEVREKKEKNKSRARFWEMAGSKIGKITGGRKCQHVLGAFVIQHLVRSGNMAPYGIKSCRMSWSSMGHDVQIRA